MKQAVEKIGIDAGGTLFKLVYQEGFQLHYKTFAGDDLKGIKRWVDQYPLEVPIHLTGGQALSLSQHLDREVEMVSEFQATCKGIRYLINEKGDDFKQPIIVTNIGTGTSIHYIHMEQEERLSGTGIGGGTFVGLSTLLTGINQFSDLAKLSLNGKRGSVDIKVKDIYKGSIPPISGELTASNFGKAKSQTNKVTSAADQVAAVAGMVAEVVALMSVHEAKKYDVKSIYYIGSTVLGQSLICNLLVDYTIHLGYEPKFLSHGHFSGAIGALMTQGNDSQGL